LLEANTLSRAETRKLALGENPPFDRTIALRDDGGWHADPDEMSGRLGSELLLDARTMVSDLLKEDYPDLGKKKRRKVEEVMVDRHGRLKGAALERLLDPTVRREMRCMVAQKFGLPSNLPSLDTLAQVMAGELPPVAADIFVVELLRDLVNLFSVAPTLDQAEQLFGYLRVAGRRIAEPMAEAATTMERFVSEYGLDAVRRLRADRPPLDKPRWIANTRANVLSRFWEDERKRRGAGPRIRGEAWFENVEASPFGSIPTLDAYLAAGAELISKAVTVSRQPYRGRHSDAADVLHMSYLPYVDVFRCDGGNSQVARTVVSELKLDVKVAPTIEEIFNILERK
jgi:hypothetical protein